MGARKPNCANLWLAGTRPGIARDVDPCSADAKAAKPSENQRIVLRGADPIPHPMIDRRRPGALFGSDVLLGRREPADKPNSRLNGSTSALMPRACGQSQDADISPWLQRGDRGAAPNSGRRRHFV